MPNPSPSNDYKADRGLKISVAVWNEVFGSIGSRLRAAEAKSTDYDEVVDRLTQQALDSISQNITAEIEASRDDIATLQNLAVDLEGRITSLLASVSTEDVRIKTVISGLVARTLHAALIELLGMINTNQTDITALKNRKRISVTSLYLGG